MSTSNQSGKRRPRSTMRPPAPKPQAPQSDVAPRSDQAAASKPSRLPIMGMGLVSLDEDPWTSLSESEIRALTVQMLAREMNSGRVVAFVGSGVSREYGYPDWQQFVKVMTESTSRSRNGQSVHPVLSWYLLKIQDQAGQRQRKPTPDEMILALDACQEVLDARGNGAFAEAVKSALGSGDKPTSDPLAALIRRLRLRRFVTTNYDHCIEESLKKHAFCNGGGRQIGRTLRSLTTGEECAASLVQFASDVPEYRYGVWHCHGSIEHPSKLVVTTRDYQQAYFSDGSAETNARQSMELVLSSNPILFVGYGMREPDVLRPLREFAATRCRGKPESPFFALLEDQFDNDMERAAVRRQNYARYGVKVILYEKGKSLAKAVEDLADELELWWKRWRQKPPLRSSHFGYFGPDERLMIRHNDSGHVAYEARADQAAPPSAHTFRCPEDFDPIHESLKHTGLTVVLGGPGSGKGSLGTSLVARWLQERPDGGKAFLATCRFSNDFLSVVQAATRHFARDKEKVAPSNDPFEELRRSLNSSNNHLLVIGGFERLLNPVHWIGDSPAPESDGLEWARVANADPTDAYGKPLAPEIRDLIEIFANATAKVVVLSTLCPVVSESVRAKVRIERLAPVNMENVQRTFRRELGGKGDISEKGVDKLARELYALTGGHTYALTVLLAVAMREGSCERWLDSVVTRLSSVEPTNRPERAVAIAIERLWDGEEPPGQRIRILQCIALATTPMDASSVATALAMGRAQVDEAIQELLNLQLLIRIAPPRHDPTLPKNVDPTERFTGHSLVRRCVLYSAGSYSLSVAEPQKFVLPCYSDEAEETHQVSEAAQAMVFGCVDQLLRELESPRAKSILHSRQLARAAFGIVRSRWSAIGLSQLAHLEAPNSSTHYENYQRILFRLCNAIRRATPPEKMWEYFGVGEGQQHDNGILYADELAWLYNELGLIAFIRGSLGNAQSLWLQGLEINRVAEAGKQGRRWRQSMLNLAIVAVERARLETGQRSLEQVLQAAQADHDHGTYARARGFLGWVYHLRGDDTLARRHYSAAIDQLREIGVARGRSLFLRQLGDLHRRFGRFSDARECLARSIASAEHGGHLDLLNWARLSQAILALAEEKQTAAAGVEDVLAFALRMGIPKLEAAALQVRAEAALGSRDLGHAASMARRSLAISTRLGMGLRVNGNFVVLGRIAQAQGDTKAARELFACATRLGRQHGYQLRVEQAERGLRELPS